MSEVVVTHIEEQHIECKVSECSTLVEHSLSRINSVSTQFKVRDNLAYRYVSCWIDTAPSDSIDIYTTRQSVFEKEHSYFNGDAPNNTFELISSTSKLQHVLNLCDSTIWQDLGDNLETIDKGYFSRPKPVSYTERYIDALHLDLHNARFINIEDEVLRFMIANRIGDYNFKALINDRKWRVCSQNQNFPIIAKRNLANVQMAAQKTLDDITNRRNVKVNVVSTIEDLGYFGYIYYKLVLRDWLR